MQISQLLRETADRFNRAADMVCVEWSEEVGANGVCCPISSSDFSRLVKAKIALMQMQSNQPVALHQQKISA